MVAFLLRDLCPDMRVPQTSETYFEIQISASVFFDRSQTPAVTRMQSKRTECVVLWLTVTYYTYVFRPDTSSMQELLYSMVWIHQSTAASIMFVLATN